MGQRGSRRSIVLAIALAIAALAAILPGGALASPARATEYVGLTAGNNTGCGSPGFTSIQDAVSAAPNGGTVYLCGNNTYSEPVVISNKRLTLTGAKGATIGAPAVWPDQDSLLPSQLTQNGVTRPWAIVLVWGADANATISNLTISGPFNGSSCTDQLFGILDIEGANATIRGDSVTGIQQQDMADYGGCQQGVAVQIGRMYWPGAPGTGEVDFVGHATITNTTVTGYQKNGITVDGAGSTVTFTGNTITGAGRVAYTAQNGIQISRGATGTVSGNRISGNAYTGGTAAEATGILVYGGAGDPISTNVQVSANILTNNDVGVSFSDYNADGTGSPATPTTNRAIGNVITNNAVTNYCTAGYDGCYGYITYQVGVADFGNQDTIMLNFISGTGYVNSANDPANGVYIEGIDTSDAISPRVLLNVVR